MQLSRDYPDTVEESWMKNRGIGQPTLERGSWRVEFVNVWARTELPTDSQTSHNNTLQNQLFVDGLGMTASLPCSC